MNPDLGSFLDVGPNLLLQVSDKIRFILEFKGKSTDNQSFQK
jgi:hypothetical protein